MKKKKLWIAIIILIIGAVFFSYNPANNILFPKCPFLFLTGFRCPGCGSQRAIHCLLHLDVMKAIYYNALLVFSLPIVAILTFAEYNRVNKPNFYIKIHNSVYLWIYCSVVILWWIIRNIFIL